MMLKNASAAATAVAMLLTCSGASGSTAPFTVTAASSCSPQAVPVPEMDDRVWQDRDYPWTNKGAYPDDTYFIKACNKDKNTNWKIAQYTIKSDVLPLVVYLDFWTPGLLTRGFAKWDDGSWNRSSYPGVSFIETNVGQKGPGVVMEKYFDPGEEINLGGNDGMNTGTYLVFVWPVTTTTATSSSTTPHTITETSTTAHTTTETSTTTRAFIQLQHLFGKCLSMRSSSPNRGCNMTGCAGTGHSDAQLQECDSDDQFQLFEPYDESTKLLPLTHRVPGSQCLTVGGPSATVGGNTCKKLTLQTCSTDNPLQQWEYSTWSYPNNPKSFPLWTNVATGMAIHAQDVEGLHSDNFVFVCPPYWHSMCFYPIVASEPAPMPLTETRFKWRSCRQNQWSKFRLPVRSGITWKACAWMAEALGYPMFGLQKPSCSRCDRPDEAQCHFVGYGRDNDWNWKQPADCDDKVRDGVLMGGQDRVAVYEILPVSNCSVMNGTEATDVICACGATRCTVGEFCSHDSDPDTCRPRVCSTTDGSEASSFVPCTCGSSACTSIGDACTAATGTCSTELHLAPPGAAGCDWGYSLSKAECWPAVEMFAAHHGEYVAENKVGSGGGWCKGGADWGQTPEGCSALTHGAWIGMFKTGSSKEGCVHEAYRPVCRTTRPCTVQDGSGPSDRYPCTCGGSNTTCIVGTCDADSGSCVCPADTPPAWGSCSEFASKGLCTSDRPWDAVYCHTTCFKSRGCQPADCSRIDGSGAAATLPCTCGTSLCSGMNNTCHAASDQCQLGACSSTDGSAVAMAVPCACGAATCSGVTDTCHAASNTCTPAALDHALSVSGPCTVSENCVRSPNYPAKYGDGESCTISPGGTVQVWAQSFDTESLYDELYVNGKPHSGSVGPAGVLIAEDITWSSDGSQARSGWEVCFAPLPACSSTDGSGAATALPCACGTSVCSLEGDICDAGSNACTRQCWRPGDRAQADGSCAVVSSEICRGAGYGSLTLDDASTKQYRYEDLTPCGGWRIVYRQTLPTLFGEHEWSKNPDDPNNDNYAILDRLEEFRNSDGAFQLKLSWPSSGLQDQVWEQTNNPYLIRKRFVTGYKPISAPYTDNWWGGLEFDRGTHDGCLMDGSSREGTDWNLWHYCVGARKTHAGGIPGPSAVVQKVELYAKEVESGAVATLAAPTPAPCADDIPVSNYSACADVLKGSLCRHPTYAGSCNTTCFEHRPCQLKQCSAQDGSNLSGTYPCQCGHSVCREHQVCDGQSCKRPRDSLKWAVCYGIRTQEECIGSRDKRSNRLLGQPCMWCCGRNCMGGSHRKCEASTLINAKVAFSQEGQNALGYYRCLPRCSILDGSNVSSSFPCECGNARCTSAAAGFCDVEAGKCDTVSREARLGLLCKEHEHVAGGKCRPCRSGFGRSAGDDPREGDTACHRGRIQTFDVGEVLAVHLPWKALPSTYFDAESRQPLTTHIATCQDQVFVTWSSQHRLPWKIGSPWQSDSDIQGHITSFRQVDGELKMTGNHAIEGCREMGGITASPDCQIIAALCITALNNWQVPNFQPIPNVEPPWGNGTQTAPNGMWTGGIMKSRRWYAYVYEWNSGAVAPKSDRSFMVSQAIGHWRYGSWSLSLSKDKYMYSVSLKIEWQSHQASVRLWFRRHDLRLSGNVFGCGGGHTLWNEQVYNEARGRWGYWCWSDARASHNAVWFVESKNSVRLVEKIPWTTHGENNAKRFYSGGPTDIVSRGSNGYIGVYTRLVDQNKNSAQQIKLAKIDGDQVVTTIDMDLKKSEDLSVTYPHLERIGNTSEHSNTFLLGYADFDQGYNPYTPQAIAFNLAEIDENGNVLNKFETASGWSDSSEWGAIPDSGCVVWAYVWNDGNGPSGPYGSWRWWDSRDHSFSRSLRMTLVCPLDPNDEPRPEDNHEDSPFDSSARQLQLPVPILFAAAALGAFWRR